MKRRFKPAFVQSLSYRRFNDILDYTGNPADTLCREVFGKNCFVEIFVESVYRRHLSLYNGEMRILADGTDEGFGCRLIRDGQVPCGQIQYYFTSHLGFGSANDFLCTLKNLTSGAFPGKWHSIISGDGRQFIRHDREMSMLNAAYDAARKTNWRLDSVTAEWEETCRSYRVLNSEQMDTSGEDHLVSLTVQASLRNGSTVHKGMATSGGRCAPGHCADLRPEATGKEAAEKSEEQTSAKPCPSGVYPVILAAGRCGIVIHEMIAHQLEADVVLNGLSVFSGRLGDQVAPSFIRVVDDGTIATGRGTSVTDDEGTPSRRNVLIENGILKNFLHDRLTSRKTGVSPTGSARRENYRYPPLPRARNTFIESTRPGSSDDLIRPVKKGLYVTSVNQGQADPLTGTFVFTAQDGFWIENGKPVFPVRPAMMMGNSREIMSQIEAAGNDTILETAAGDCVKDGQRIPVSFGNPAIRISSILIQPTE